MNLDRISTICIEQQTARTFFGCIAEYVKESLSERSFSKRIRLIEKNRKKKNQKNERKAMKRKLTSACLAMALSLTPVMTQQIVFANEPAMQRAARTLNKDDLFAQVIDDDDASIVYSEGTANTTGWTGGSGSTAAESEHWSNVAGSTFTLTFTGSGVEIYGIKASNHRKFTIQIDELDPVTCDAYAESRSDGNQILFSSFDEGMELEEGQHTLLFTSIDEANESADSGTLGLSFTYAKVYSAEEEEPDPFAGYTVIDDIVTTDSDELFAISYPEDGWVGGADSGSYGGTEHYINGIGSLEMRFIGTKVEYYGAKASAHGTYTFYIDGEEVGSASGNSSSRETQQLIFASETLEEGPHTLRVVLQESDKALQIDYLKVYHDAIAPESLTLSTDVTQMAPGTQGEIEAVYSPWYAYCPKVEWKSSNSDVLSIRGGTMTASESLTERTTVTITATIPDTDISASKDIVVDPALSIANVYVGDEMRLDLGANWQSLHTKSGRDYAATIWKNDTASAKLVVNSMDEALSHVTLSASAFTNEAGDVLDPSLITLGWLDEVSISQGRGSSSAPHVAYPEKITENRAIDMAAQSTRFAWVSLCSNKDTAPGIYHGTIEVDADELDAPFSFPFTLDVLNLDLPDTTTTELQLWQHPFAVADYYNELKDSSNQGYCTDSVSDFYFSDEHFALMRDSYEDYAAIGGHDLVANIVEEAWNHQSYYNDPSMIKWTKKADGTWSFDYTWYDQWINFGLETGVLDPENGVGAIKCYSMVPWNNQISWYDEASGKSVTQSFTPGNDDWTEIWTAFLRDFLAHSKEKGWLDMTYIAMDERTAAQLRPAVNLVHSITTDEGERFLISSCLNDTALSDTELTANIDDVCANLSTISDPDSYKELCEERRAQGKKTTFYTCTGNRPSNFASSDPIENYWTMWYSMRLGSDGYLRWAFDNYLADMHGDATYRYWEPGDGWFIYPMEVSRKNETVNGKNYYSTPRYEAIRKGMRDVAKAKSLLERDDVSDESKQAISTAIDALYAPSEGRGSYGEAVMVYTDEHEELFTLTRAIEDAVNKAAREVNGDPEEPDLLDYDALALVTTEAQALDLTACTNVPDSFAPLLEQSIALIDHADSQKEIDEKTDALHRALLELRYAPDADRLDTLKED